MKKGKVANLSSSKAGSQKIISWFWPSFKNGLHQTVPHSTPDKFISRKSRWEARDDPEERRYDPEETIDDPDTDSFILTDVEKDTTEISITSM